MNVVLDTNILIAALIAKGFCHTLVEQCLRVHSVITIDILTPAEFEAYEEQFGTDLE